MFLSFLSCSNPRHTAYFYIQFIMSSQNEEKYGQKQQIGSRESDMASRPDPKVKDSHFHDTRESARLLMSLKEWHQVENKKSKRGGKSDFQVLTPEPDEAFEMNQYLTEKNINTKHSSKRHNVAETKKRIYSTIVRKTSPHSLRNRYLCGRCYNPKKDHVCSFKIVGYDKISVPPRPLVTQSTFWKCGVCGDFKDDHLCVPKYEPRSVDEMLIAHQYYELCIPHFPVRAREINNRVWLEGEMEERIRLHPAKRPRKEDVEPHAIELNSMTESFVAETETVSDPNETIEDLPRFITSEQQRLFDSLSEALSVSPTEKNEDVACMISEIENIFIFSLQVMRSDSIYDFALACMACIKMHTSTSMLQSILESIDEFKWAQGEIQPQSQFSFKNAWEMIKNHDFWPKISTLIAAAMSVSACAVKNVTWSPYGFNLVKIEASKKAYNAFDLLDCCVDLFSWFVETGAQVIKQQSLWPILYSNQSMQEYNTKCDFIITHISQVVAGNYSGSVEEFDSDLDWCLRKTLELRNLKHTGPTSSWLQNRMTTLMECKNKIISYHQSATIRFFPMCVAITGETGVGKTNIAKTSMKIMLGSMGFNPDVRFQRTRNWDQKHDNEILSSTIGLYYDDVGASKAQFVEKSEAASIIHENNGVPLCANKADLESKGVTFFQHKAAVATSNFHDLNFHHYSDYPAAALNRFVFVRVSVKPEFAGPNGVSLDKENPIVKKSDPFADLWDIRLERVVVRPQPNGKTGYYFETFKYEARGEYYDTSSLNVTQYLRLLSLLAKDHKAQQDRVMETTRKIDTLELCSGCSLFESICTCPRFTPNTVDPHSLLLSEYMGGIVRDAAVSGLRSYVHGWVSPFGLFDKLLGYSCVRRYTTRKLANELETSIDAVVTPFVIAVTPEWLMNTHYFQVLCKHWRRVAAFQSTKQILVRAMLMSCALIYVWYQHFVYGHFVSLPGWLPIVCLCATWFRYAWIYSCRVRALREEYFSRRDALPEFAKQLRDSDYTKAGVAVAAIVVCLKILKMWNATRVKPQATLVEPSTVLSALSPSSVDDQPSWFGSVMRSVGLNVDTGPSSKHVATDDMVKAFERNNLFHAVLTHKDVSMKCNIFFPRKGLALLPAHVFYDKNQLGGTRLPILEVAVHRSDKPGGRFTFKADDTNMVFDEVLDCAAIHVPNCPDLKDRTGWLPISHPKGSSIATLLVRKSDQFLTDSVTVTCGKVAHKYRSEMPGGTYSTSLAQNGACMGLVVSESKQPCVLGVHIGGTPSIRFGVMQTILQSDVEKWVSELEEKGCYALAHATDLPSAQYGRELITTDSVHPHSIFAGLDSQAVVDLVGSTRLRTKQKSTVIRSPLSDHITDVCGVPCKWTGPQLEPNWAAYNATLVHAVNPVQPFDPMLMKRAGDDWLRPLIPLAKGLIAPLTDSEAIIGQHGVRFIDALPMSTSMGFPLFGKKNKYFDEICVDGQLIDRVPHEDIVAERNRLLGQWSKGLRAYPVTSATLKDEPTAMVFENGEWKRNPKVRVFQCSAVAMSLCIRKYFLPIIRFLATHPLESECAIGLNCMSPQWEQLLNHAWKYADDGKVLALDYSKYDVRMNSQLTHFVWCRFIDLAIASGGYTPEDIRIMKMMITDIVHPLIDWNGTMIMLYSMNTSGHNLTVNLNSGSNSILTRMGFFTVYPEETDFRSCVAATTYGDDLSGSVRPDRRGFNFETYRDFLEDHGMKITLPDKSEDSVEFLPKEKADFLKRTSNFVPELGISVGALDEDSIFKSLHVNLKSRSETPKQVAASCMETAMHEWVAHGRSVYELRQKQMQEVCKRARLPVAAVDVPFDHRIEQWYEKHKKT